VIDNGCVKHQEAKKPRSDTRQIDRGSEPEAETDAIARVVVDAALEVHRTLGPRYVESTYEHALCLELASRGVPYDRQASAVVTYKGTVVGRCQLDLVVARRVVVELKSVEAIAPIHVAQLISYLKATQLTVGLLINFNVQLLKHGLRRVFLNPKDLSCV
jgi:GxxExxY protein